MLTIPDAISAYAAAVSSMNAEKFTACFAPGGELRDPITAPPAVAPAGTTQFFNQFVPLAEAVSFRPGRVFVAGNQAAFAWTLEATGKNGRVAVADGIDIAVFDENGKIVRLDGYWDTAAFVGTLTA